MNNSDIIERLVNLVMSERQAKVYLALLHRGSASSADLQKSSGIPQTKIYEIVRYLVSQGYCRERKAGHKRTFEAIDPQTALISNVQHLESLIQEIKNLKEELSEVYAKADKSAVPLEYIEILYGNENIHRHYCQFVNGANKEVLGFGREPYAWDDKEELYEQERQLEGVLERGGVSRWVFELRFPDHIPILEYMRSLQKKGVRYRVAESLPLKLMIFDRQILLLAEEEPSAQKGELTMSIIRQNTIVCGFQALFEFIWEQSTELDEWSSQQVISLKEGSFNLQTNH